jgi:glutamate dehydrogenase/leucine dehydrogenase
VPTFLENTQKFVAASAETAHISGDILARLRNPDHIFEFEIPVKMDDGTEQKFQAWRVQHNNALGPYKGGIRFHPDANLDEVKALAFLMTLKTSLVGLPLGGAKGAVRVHPNALSVREVEELSRGYVRAIWQDIGSEKDIPAPDVGTNSEIIDWMTDEYEKLTGAKSPAAFTGKSLAHGGSHGRETATGFGGYVILREFLNHHDAKLERRMKVAVQGVGNVGSFFLRSLFRDERFLVVAVSNSKGGVYRDDGVDGAGVLATPKDLTGIEGDVVSNEELLGLDVDVLALAALEDAVMEMNAGVVRAHTVLELANGPVSYDADLLLAQKKIHVIPDILANSGGVVGSYFEWVQNREGVSWSEQEALGKIETTLVGASKKVFEYARKKNVSLRHAAYALALLRLAGAMQ